jgi:glycosyl transferase-like sugar-binding protein
MAIETMHFIWMGALIETDKRQNIIKWGEHLNKITPFSIVLWTDRVAETKSLLGQADVEVKDVKLLDTALASYGASVAKGVMGKTVDSAAWDKLKTYAIDNRSSTYVGRNYGISSDIYRLAALYEHGGVYMDCDNTVLARFSPTRGQAGAWEVEAGKIVWYTGAGNSYLAANKKTEALIYVLLLMAFNRHNLDLEKHTKAELAKYQDMTKAEITTKNTDKKSKEYDDAFVLNEAWTKFLKEHMSSKNEINAFDLQRYFPSVYPGGKQTAVETSGFGMTYWNPRLKYTTATTGPAQFQMAAYEIKDRIQVNEIELTGWVFVGSAHDWVTS